MLEFLRVVQSFVLKTWNKLWFHTVAEKRRRIMALDILRGLFLVVLIVNHISWSPSFFSFITGKSDLFASAAEGFFVVSGILVGYIYGPKFIKARRDTIKRLLKRGLLLYILSVGGTLLYTLVAIGLPVNYVGIESWGGSLQSYLLNTFSLRYSYGWIDFLNRYAIFMFMAPIALWLITRGKAWVVLLASALVWLTLRDFVYLVPFTGWQLVFMTGIVIGYYLPNIEKYATSLSRSQKKAGVTLLFSAALLTYLLSVIWSVIVPFVLSTQTQLLSPTLTQLLSSLNDYRAVIWNDWFSKSSVEFGRLAIGTLWFGALYVFVRLYEQRIVTTRFGIVLEYLGRHSLFVYVTHGIILVLANIFMSPPSDYSNLAANTVIAGFIVWLVYKITVHRDMFDRTVTGVRRRVNREEF